MTDFYFSMFVFLFYLFLYFFFLIPVYFLILSSCDVVVEEFPQEERDPVYIKEGQGAVLLCAPPKTWPGTYRPPCLRWKSHSCEDNNLFMCIRISLLRGGDLPLDLQRVPAFPAHGSPALCLAEDGEPVHLQSGGSGRRKLLLLCFQPHHREECLLQVHPPHPLTP